MSDARRHPTEPLSDASRRTMDALAGGVDVFETFFERVKVGLALADLGTHFVRVNDTYADLVGSPAEDVIGMPLLSVVHPDDRPVDDAKMALLLAGKLRSISNEERLVGPDRRETWVLHGVSVVPDEKGRPMWLAVSAQDITERRQAEQELRQLSSVLAARAIRDPLTGLANRALLHERLRGALSKDARGGSSTGVLFLDLDGFKAVNDRFGHAAGDTVLITVGERLTAAVRPSDTVARLGGDEFVVLVESAVDEALPPLIRRLEETVREPIRVGTTKITVGVSVGVAMSHRGDAEPSALLATADRSMYDAKRASQAAGAAR